MHLMPLRAQQAGAAGDDPCGAWAGRALGAVQSHNAQLLCGLTTIPTASTGDAHWWHSDIFDAVERANLSRNWAKLFFIAARPACNKNQDCAGVRAPGPAGRKIRPRFSRPKIARSVPRAAPDDPTTLGRKHKWGSGRKGQEHLQTRQPISQASAITPAASIAATAAAASLSELSPVTPTAPITLPLASRSSTPPGTGTTCPPKTPLIAFMK